MGRHSSGNWDSYGWEPADPRSGRHDDPRDDDGWNRSRASETPSGEWGSSYGTEAQSGGWGGPYGAERHSDPWGGSHGPETPSGPPGSAPGSASGSDAWGASYGEPSGRHSGSHVSADGWNRSAAEPRPDSGSFAAPYGTDPRPDSFGTGASTEPTGAGANPYDTGAQAAPWPAPAADGPRTASFVPRPSPSPEEIAAEPPAWGLERPDPARRPAVTVTPAEENLAETEAEPEPDLLAERAPDHTNPPPTPPWYQRVPPILLIIGLTGGLVIGSQTERWAYAAGIGLAQAAAVVCLTWVRGLTSPWSVWISAGAGLLAGNAFAVEWPQPSISPLLGALALAAQLSLIVHLLNPKRGNTVDAMGTASLAAVLVFGYSCFIVLSRLGAAPPAVYASLIAGGCALLTARAVDFALPDPRVNRQIPRGAFGVVLGTMCGTAAAAYAGMVIEGPEPQSAAIGGLLVSLTAILADTAVAYIVASRRIDGDGGAPWPVTGMAGPLFAFAMTGPVVYLLSAYYIVT